MPGPLGGTIGIVGRPDHRRCSGQRQPGQPYVRGGGGHERAKLFCHTKRRIFSPLPAAEIRVYLLGGNLGIFGIVLGLYWLSGHLAGLSSFRIPYLMPFVGAEMNDYHDRRDSFVRAPFAV